MKRTAPTLNLRPGSCNVWEQAEEITCSVVGEMADGTKVWMVSSDSEDQYSLIRLQGHYYFLHM